jgi:hypothetical protein
VTVSQPTYGHGGNARNDEETNMVRDNGWTRICPECGNSDGAKVERIALHPTFRCECGYVRDGSGATLVGLFEIDGNAADDELDAWAKVIAERMNAAAADPIGRDEGQSCGDTTADGPIRAGDRVIGRAVTGYTSAVTGMSRMVVVPSPSCPVVLAPQHLTVPAPNNAHVWFAPAATAIAVVRPVTVTGVDELVVVLVAELARSVESPTLDAPSCEDRARMRRTGRDRDRARQGGHRDWQ